MMSRSRIRTLSLVLTLALSIAMQPSPAQASASATAQLIAGLDTLPGTRNFSIRVHNTDSRSPILGLRIDTVSIILPSEAGIRTAPAVSAPTGWKVNRIDNRGLQRYLYRSENSGIPAGGNQTFTFPAEVAAPFDRDRIATFRVSASDDGGATTSSVEPSPGGTLSTTIRVLEVVPGSLRAVAPAGVVDGSGTAGQAITYEFAVRNHSRSTLQVMPSLEASGPEQIGAGIANAIPSAGQDSFRHEVTLGNAANDRVMIFTGRARATDSVARAETAPFAVQAPPQLSLQIASFDPTHVRSNAPISYVFTGNVSKIGTPSLTLDFGDLRFGANTAALAPPSYPSGSAARNLEWDITEIVGNDGVYAAQFRFVGTDGNGADFKQVFSASELVTIDNIAPFIAMGVEMPFDDFGTPQSAIKQGDRPLITGTIDGADRLRTFQLAPVGGPPLSAINDVTYGSTDDGAAFGASPTVPFAEDAGVFRIEAAANDRAGNTGAAVSRDIDIDNVRPSLASAVIRSATTIRLGFGEQVIGSCDPTEWLVGGEANVDHVTYEDGTRCSPGAQDNRPDSFRILHLVTPLEDPESSTSVAYSPQALSPARDGAGNVTPSATVTAASSMLPPAPPIAAVLRRDDASPVGAYEPAVLDDDAYWTNVGGSDGVLVRFDGGRAGRQIQVLDEAGNVVVSGDSESGQVHVPLGTVDGSYIRRIRFVTSSGVGPSTDLRVALDTVAPTLAAATLVQEDRIRIDFSEKMWAGTNFAVDWYGLEHNVFNLPEDPDDDYVYYQAQRVEVVDPFTRLLWVDMQGLMSFAGAEYMLSSENGERYEDRAGNKMRDSRRVS